MLNFKVREKSWEGKIDIVKKNQRKLKFSIALVYLYQRFRPKFQVIVTSAKFFFFFFFVERTVQTVIINNKMA